jgi:hypothetical protein
MIIKLKKEFSRLPASGCQTKGVTLYLYTSYINSNELAKDDEKFQNVNCY